MNPIKTLIMWIKAKWHFRGMGVKISIVDHNPSPRLRLIEEATHRISFLRPGSGCATTMEDRVRAKEDYDFFREAKANFKEFAKGDPDPDTLESELEWYMMMAEEVFGK